MTYWYVTYSYSSDRVHGMGALNMYTTESWFPIKMARNWIKDHIKSDTVVILDWKKITSDQYEENK
jgi:hypothetical protein